MDLCSSILVCLVLVASAAGLMLSHVSGWRRTRNEDLEPEERDFRYRQFRRRMQTSAMLGVLGAAVPSGQLLTVWFHSRLFAILFWGGVLVLILWIALLAAADILATKFHFDRMRRKYVIEQAKLRATAQRMQSVRGNGRKS